MNVLERTVRMDVRKAEKNGPPICPLILHQPKRPKNKTDDEFICKGEEYEDNKK